MSLLFHHQQQSNQNIIKKKKKKIQTQILFSFHYITNQTKGSSEKVTKIPQNPEQISLSYNNSMPPPSIFHISHKLKNSGNHIYTPIKIQTFLSLQNTTFI